MSLNRAIYLHPEKDKNRDLHYILIKLKTNPWFNKCHKLPEHCLLDHSSLVQPLAHHE